MATRIFHVATVRMRSWKGARVLAVPLLLAVGVLSLACHERPDARAYRAARARRTSQTDSRGAHGSVSETPSVVFDSTPSQSAESIVYVEASIDSRVRTVPSDVMAGLARNPSKYLSALVGELLDGIADDSVRVKILHDWVADNVMYDAKAFFSGTIGDQDFANTLRTGKAVCAGYASLFQRMCEVAGLECVVISGYARGYGFRVFGTENPAVSNHAWNAVRVGGQWKLVDVTWDAGHISAGDYTKEYSTKYFFIAPSHIIYTHLPADPQWQLLARPLAPEAFVRLPFLTGEFFRFGLRVATPLEATNNVARHASIEILAPPRVSIIASLLKPDGGEVEDCVDVQRDGNMVRVSVLFPSRGRWLVRLFAAHADPDGPHNSVCEIGFVSSEAVP
jgi:transglutaminase/protease-like cytokinesis protein 3